MANYLVVRNLITTDISYLHKNYTDTTPMTKEELINSGNLEAYLLGDLTTEESTEVEKLKELYVEVKEELNLIEESLILMSERTRIRPRSNVKKEFMSSFQSPTKVKPLPQFTPSKPGLDYMKAAAATFFLISTMAIYILYEKEKGLKKLYETVLADNNHLVNQNNILETRLDLQQERVALISTPDFLKVGLNDNTSSGTPAVTAYWNNKVGKLFLVIIDIPEIEAEQDFQLWAIIEGKPIDVGIVGLNNISMQEMRSVRGAQAFAITIEPKGGSEKPTLENMILSGAVSL